LVCSTFNVYFVTVLVTALPVLLRAFYVCTDSGWVAFTATTHSCCYPVRLFPLPGCTVYLPFVHTRLALRLRSTPTYVLRLRVLLRITTAAVNRTPRSRYPTTWVTVAFGLRLRIWLRCAFARTAALGLHAATDCLPFVCTPGFPHPTGCRRGTCVTDVADVSRGAAPRKSRRLHRHVGMSSSIHRSELAPNIKIVGARGSGRGEILSLRSPLHHSLATYRLAGAASLPCGCCFCRA